MEIVRSVLLSGLPGSPNERSPNAVSYKDRAALPIRCEANLPLLHWNNEVFLVTSSFVDKNVEPCSS